jgi:hypothetical protein
MVGACLVSALPCLVALSPVPDLLLFAKHLFVTAIVGGLRRDLVNEGAEWIRERLCASAQPHEGPRNKSSNNAHEPTNARSTCYGNGYLIRVFRYTGHIFS